MFNVMKMVSLQRSGRNEVKTDAQGASFIGATSGIAAGDIPGDNSEMVSRTRMR